MDNTYKFQSQNRDYSTWSIIPPIDNIDPVANKLLVGDEFTISDNKELAIIYSPIRENKSIPGILILNGNQTFGRSANGRVLYKCIPFDKTLPVFLIPYDLKIGFHKLLVNKYILFQFSNWTSKHPAGIITETIGYVNDFCAFCTYQLWTRNLTHSISKFNQELNVRLKSTSENEIIEQICADARYHIEDHTDEYMFTIDPVGSVDLDDGFSIQTRNDEWIVTVHIANVYTCLDTLQLWDHMTPRVSTIYLPDDRKTMLPTALSDRICSLLENTTRVTFAMEVAINKVYGVIRPDSIRFFNAKVNVSKNFRYEEKSLLKNTHYKTLFEIARKLDASVVDSHDAVAFWMVYMNSMAAQKLHASKTGVFRSVITKSHSNFTDNDCDTRRVLESWRNTNSLYQLYDESVDLRHMSLNVDSYVHITSPIRRLVDILNQICFNKYVVKNPISDQCEQFLTKQFAEIDRINADVKSIQRVQMECDMLYSCIHDPELTENSHEGIVFNRTVISDSSYRYTVYLKTVKRMYTLDSSEQLAEYSTNKFKLLLFDSENTGHRKMRIAIMDETIENTSSSSIQLSSPN